MIFPSKNKRKMFLDNFLAKVNKTKNCWNWTGTTIQDGYGRIRLNNKLILAHRASYELFIDRIPKGEGYHGMCVLHRCDNPSCVNPGHLFLGTHRENMIDMVRKNRSCNVSGENNPNSKLKLKDVLQIRKLYKTRTFKMKDLGKAFNVTLAQISFIINKKSWTYA